MLTGVICLWAILAAELFLSVRQESQTFDEAYHLLAGYRYWQAQDFGINPEHPPLAKLVATSPLLHLRPRVPAMPAGDEYFFGGWKFLYANNADPLLFKARMAASAFTFLMALLVFEATYVMFGRAPAFLALALVVFEPNILAHGALVTTDMGVTCCLFAAIYAFYRYISKRTALRLLECGFVTGLALAAKHSGILVIPILGLLALVELLIGRGSRFALAPEPEIKMESIQRQALRLVAALLVIGGIAVGVLWAFYGFRFQARPGNLKMTQPLAEFIKDMKHPAESRLILGLARRKVLPESFLYGLAAVLMGENRPMFIFGNFYPHGRWFYFPAAFVIKSTLGFLLLLLLTLAAKRLRRPEMRREVLFITIPAGFYFAVSLTSGLNIGLRHILPVYPFLLVLAAVGAWTLMKQHRRWTYVVPALLAFHAFSSLRSFPNYLAYSNEAWGGPARTYRVLTDSNVDWGQGLKAAKRYLDRRGITNCWLSYFGTADPGYYHIPCRPLHTGFGNNPGDVVPQTLQGTVLISATDIGLGGPGELNPYERFLRTKPVDNIGGSILVFEGHFDFKLGSALTHIDKVWELANNNHLDQALAEARTAVALLPRRVDSHYALASLLAQKKQTAEARREYQTALSLAQTIHPEFQKWWIPYLQEELSRL